MSIARFFWGWEVVITFHTVLALHAAWDVVLVCCQGSLLACEDLPSEHTPTPIPSSRAPPQPAHSQPFPLETPLPCWVWVLHLSFLNFTHFLLALSSSLLSLLSMTAPSLIIPHKFCVISKLHRMGHAVV